MVERPRRTTKLMLGAQRRIAWPDRLVEDTQIFNGSDGKVCNANWPF